MKRNVLLTILTAVLGLLIGYFLGGRPNPSRYDDIAVNFKTCNKECDDLRDQVRKEYRICKKELDQTLANIIASCTPPEHWTPECTERMKQYRNDREKCENEHEAGLDQIDVCRAKCNNLISIREQ